MPPSTDEREQIPAAHALHLAEVAAALGVDRDRLFEAWGLRETEVADPERAIDLETVQRLVATTRRLTGEDGLGLYLGTRMQIANHGSLGFAAMTAPTAGAALDVAMRFVTTRTRALALRHQVVGDRGALILEEKADFGDARDVVLVALVVGIWHIAQALTGRAVVGDVDFAFPKPTYARRFEALAPGRVRFDQPITQLVFDAALLDAPLVMADVAAHRRACEQCERELRGEQELASRVRTELMPSPPPDLPSVARALGMASRTLKRRLASEGTSFAAVRSDVLRERAILLLRANHTLEECAGALGYCDAASFSRAFKRWTGQTPGGYRESSA
ncbi:MAG: AraC family transcriptional regulator [Deltaproteobacteria bacterium]|nr:AraC family transcriptional regulator [Deltaproteobacteria bacterium]